MFRLKGLASLRETESELDYNLAKNGLFEKFPQNIWIIEILRQMQIQFVGGHTCKLQNRDRILY